MTITLVQAASGGADGTNPVTFSAGVNFTPGNLIIFLESCYYIPASAMTIGGIASVKVTEIEAAGGVNGDFAVCWYVVADGSVSGKDVVSTPTGGNDYHEWAILEFASTTGWPANPVTASGATPATARGNSAGPTASITVTAADAVLVSNWSNGANGSGDSGTQPTGYTRAYTAVASEGGAGSYKIANATAAGVQAPVHSVAGGAVPWGCLVIAFAAVAGSGGGAPTPLFPISASAPSAPPLPTPRSFAGGPANPPTPAWRVLSSAPQYVERPRAPALLAGFGAVVPSTVLARLVTALSVPTAELPPRPVRAAGFGQASAPAVRLSVRPVGQPLLPSPVLVPGSPNDPGVITTGGVNSAFLPDEPPPPVGPGWFAGVRPAVLAVQPAVFSSRPPLAPSISFPILVVGFGRAAQVPVILGSTALPPASLPPRPAAVAGFGDVVRVAAMLRTPDVLSPVLAPKPLWSAGFGQAAQVPVVYSGLTVQSANLPPVTRLLAGVIPPPATTSGPVVWSSTVQPVDLPPTARLFAGVVPPPVPPVAVVVRTTATTQELPPRGAVVKGFGFPSQVAQVIFAPSAAARVEPLVVGQWFAGFGEPEPVIPFIGVQTRLVQPVDLPPRPQRLEGFGFPSQVAVVMGGRAPSVVPTTVPQLLAGVVPIPAVAYVYRPLIVVEARLPDANLLNAGFGEPPQVAVVFTVLPGTTDLARLPPLPAWFAGFGEAAFIPPLQPAPPQYTAEVRYDSYDAEVDPWSNVQMIDSYVMDPAAVRVFTINWARWPFPPGTRIAAISWAVPAAFQIVSQSVFGTKANIKLKCTAAARALQDYEVACTMVSTEAGADPSRDVRRIGIQLRLR